MTGLVYDSGALIAAEDDERRFWALHERALARGVAPIVSAVVLAETAHPAMRNLRRLLVACDVQPLEMQAALRAATLRHATDDGTTVDAVVVEIALRHAAAVVTSDRGDIEALADAANRNIAVIYI